MKTRTLTAAGTIAAAVGTFALCGWAVVQDEVENRRTYEQSVQAYGPPPILNYLTDDPYDMWQSGGTP